MVLANQIRRFVLDCLTTAGADLGHAELAAEVLIEADCRGHYSHGINRLDMYVERLRGGGLRRSGTPLILCDRPASAWVDGNDLMGFVVGHFCMKLAIQKAKTCGIGIVSAKNSNHFGITGYYAMMASQQNMLGMAFTNTTPRMVPTRSKKAMLGTNPIAFAAPAVSHGVVLDMATSTVSFGKIEIAQLKNEKLPEGWALDAAGAGTTDTDMAMKLKSLTPLGGPEVTSGYKGYGLALLVEVLSGVLSGSRVGAEVTAWDNIEKSRSMGQCFIAIDCAGFAPGFRERLQLLLDELRAADLADGETGPVLVPGDIEKAHVDRCDIVGGVEYDERQMKKLDDLAKELKVERLQAVKMA